MSIFNYEIEILEADNWTPLFSWARPLHDGKTLDESLDFGRIIIPKSYRREPYKPFTPIRIGVYEVPDNELNVEKMIETDKAPYRVDLIYRLISDTQVEQRSFAYNAGEDWYRHTIDTIEFTKNLEREICDTLTFSKYLSRDYAEGAIIVTPIKGGVLSKYDGDLILRNDRYYLSRHKIGYTQEIYPADFDAYGDISYVSGDIKVIYPDGREIIVGEAAEKRYDEAIEFKVTVPNFVMDVPGPYQIIYKTDYTWQVQSAGGRRQGIWTFDLSVSETLREKKNPTVTDALNRILSLCPTRREGVEPQKYILDPRIAEKYSGIESPEFHITRATLFEALNQIGGYIHAMPRLDYPNVVTFDELGGNEEYTPPEGLRCAAYSASRSIDETCDAIDSTVENFLCTDDLGQGAVTEPCAGGWKSARCDENQFVLSNDNALILTDHPIYRVIKVEVAKRSGESWERIGDITSYVYETAEYKTLSSYGGQYPQTRAYALNYTQGDNKIKGLTFKQEAISGFCEIFNGEAIKNIIELLEGSCPTWYYDLAFRVTYIPMTSARVKQFKPFSEEGQI